MSINNKLKKIKSENLFSNKEIRSIVKSLFSKNQIRSIVKNVPSKYLAKIRSEDFIDFGAEGIVFTFNGNKIIKIAKTSKDLHQFNTVDSIFKIIKESKSNRNIVKIFDFGKLSSNTYFYVSEKLLPLSKEEITIITDVYDFSLNSYMFKQTDNKILKNKKLYQFLSRISTNSNLIVADVHSSNVMKTIKGDYKIIDLGFIRPSPLNRKTK